MVKCVSVCVCVCVSISVCVCTHVYACMRCEVYLEFIVTSFISILHTDFGCQLNDIESRFRSTDLSLCR